MSKMNLIPIKEDSLKKEGIPFKPSTLYNWRSKDKNNEIFVKIAGKIFIDADKFWEIALRQKRK